MEKRYEGRGYFATVSDDRLSLGWDGEEFFRLCPQSAVDAREARDTETALTGPEIVEKDGAWTVTWTAASTLWREKRYVFTLEPDLVTYSMTVRGEGEADEVRYFLGDRTKRFHGSGYEAADYYAPLGLANAPTANRRFTTSQECAIGIKGFTPGPFAFSFRIAGAEGRCMFGLGALKDNCGFADFRYKPLLFSLDVSRFTLVSDFGATPIKGEWTAPPVIIARAADDMDAMRRYAAWHYDHGCPRPEAKKPPRWWLGPFYCGWKEQFLGDWPDANQSAAREECYQIMAEGLAARGLKPAALIIDDKWQENYGTAVPDPKKWPDLRRFVDRQHAEGKRVVLWFKSWDAEGLPADECVTDAAGKVLAADPTNPRYAARLRAAVRKLMSDEPGCADADGFKVDFADCLPLVKGQRTYEPGVYGVALLYRLISLIHSAVKEVKPDGLVNSSCGHPLFADLTDQARLHDCFFALRDTPAIMSERQRLYRTMIPGLPVDTDAGSCGSRRDFLAYIKAQPAIGVPDLLFLHPIEDCTLRDEDFDLIRRVWEDYSRAVDAEYAD